MASTQEPSAEITTEFAILGAGAIGSILGAHLARAGRKVLMLARGERAEQIRRHGLQIKGLAAFSQPVPVLSDASRLARAEILIVATKTYSMDAALEALRSADIENTFSIQNGLAKNEQLAAVWGESRVLGALADTSGELLPTGEVLFTRNEQLYVGEISGGESVRARNIAHILDASGIRTSAVVDIRSLEWSKFTAWVALMVPSVTTRATTWQYLTDGGSALVVVRLVRELGALASALNIPLSDRAPLPISTIACSSERARSVWACDCAAS